MTLAIGRVLAILLVLSAQALHGLATPAEAVSSFSNPAANTVWTILAGLQNAAPTTFGTPSATQGKPIA